MQDAYGNYQAGLEPGPSLPGSHGRLRYGTGEPGVDFGDNGDGYVNLSNGDWYTKKNTGWELQSGVGGPATNPYGNIDPEGVETATVGVFYVNISNQTLWIKESGSGDTGWQQYI